LEAERRPVLGFLILAFALSIPFWILGSLFEIQLLPGLPIGALAAFTPAIAAAIIVYRDGRLSAVQSLLRRSLDAGRVRDRKWYFLFVLFNPAVAILSFQIMRGMGVAVPNPPPLTLAVVPLCAIFFIAALGEEIGWTGYATEPFLQRWGVLPGGVLLGSVWVAFHLIPLAQVDRSLEWIAWWSLGTLSLRTIMVWLYAHAGDSVFAAAVFHAMINLSWQLFPINGSFYDPRIFSLVTLALGVLLAISSRLVSRATRNAS
jgi:membrane protease YdiL (CAAX protease family)